MVISHSKQFIFIHNYKVAGTSIKRSLARHNHYSLRNSSKIDKVKFAVGIYPKVFSSTFPDHTKAIELREQIPNRVFETYFKFGFVRNPWDWQVSLYTYMLKLTSHPQHELIKSMKNFDEYIDWRVHNDLHLQKEFFFDQDNMLVDFIGRMENLEDDFKTVCESVNIACKLPHLNSSREDNDCLKFYSDKSLTMVEQAFREDIEIFKYERP